MVRIVESKNSSRIVFETDHESGFDLLIRNTESSLSSSVSSLQCQRLTVFDPSLLTVNRGGSFVHEQHPIPSQNRSGHTMGGKLKDRPSMRRQTK